MAGTSGTREVEVGTTSKREVRSQTLGLERERGHVVVVLVLREAEPGAEGVEQTLPFDRSAPLTGMLLRCRRHRATARGDRSS